MIVTIGVSIASLPTQGATEVPNKISTELAGQILCTSGTERLLHGWRDSGMAETGCRRTRRKLIGAHPGRGPYLSRRFSSFTLVAEHSAWHYANRLTDVESYSATLPTPSSCLPYVNAVPLKIIRRPIWPRDDRCRGWPRRSSLRRGFLWYNARTSSSFPTLRTIVSIRRGPPSGGIFFRRV